MSYHVTCHGREKESILESVRMTGWVEFYDLHDN